MRGDILTPYQVHLGRAVRAIRVEMGLSVTQVARECGVARRTIRVIETRDYPTARQLLMVALALGVNPGDFFSLGVRREEDVDYPPVLKELSEELDDV